MGAPSQAESDIADCAGRGDNERDGVVSPESSGFAERKVSLLGKRKIDSDGISVEGEARNIVDVKALACEVCVVNGEGVVQGNLKENPAGR